MAPHRTQIQAVKPNVHLRRLEPRDLLLVFEWRNLPLIIELSSSQQPVTWEQHTAWFPRVLSSDDCLVFIIEHNGQPVGQARFDLDDGPSAIISIYLLPEHCGHGLGTAALQLACEQLHATRPDIPVINANIRATNARSIQSFKKAGFRLAETGNADESHVRMLLPLPPSHST
jgi:ribosomal protein S18 acetylase RimI-like enzyme